LIVPSFQGVDTLVEYAIKSAKERNICKAGQKAIVLLSDEQNPDDESHILKIKKIL
jgi:pyruvate kinase